MCTALQGAELQSKAGWKQELTIHRHAEAHLPTLPLKKFVARLFRFTLLKALSMRPIFGLLCWAVAVCGFDLESLLGGVSRSFPSGMLMEQIRHRAPAPLLRLLERRLRTYDGRRVAKRTAVGRAMLQALRGAVRIPGAQALQHTFWVFPVSVTGSSERAQHLRRCGFDCTPGASSMCVIEPPDGRKHEAECPLARKALDNILYLPVQPGLSSSDVKRVTDGVRS